MTGISEYKDSIERELEKYDSYLEGAKAASDIVPIVSELRDEAQAKLNVLNNTPDDVLSESIPKILPGQIKDETKKKAAIPELPFIDRAVLVSLVSSSGTADAYTTIVTPFLQMNPQPEWVGPVTSMFNEFAEEKARKTILPGLIADINAGLVDQFRTVVDSYEKARGGLHRTDQALNGFRSIIQQLWGALAERARLKCPEKVGKGRLELGRDANRQLVASCLGGNRVGEVNLHLAGLSSLYKEISPISKDVVQNDIAGMRQYYTKWILLLNAVLSIISDQNENS